jgi:hypothetical protein
MHNKLGKRERRLRFVTHLKRRVLECCVADLGKHNTLNLLKTYKNQKTMLVGKATHNQQWEEKNLFLGKKFFSLKTYDKNGLK